MKKALIKILVALLILTGLAAGGSALAEQLEGEPEIEVAKSYYVSQLTELERSAYDIITANARNFEKEVPFSTPIPENQLRKVLNIIMLDEPDLLHIAPKVSYIMDQDKNVSKVFLNFNMNQEEYNKALSDLNNKISLNRTDDPYELMDLMIDEVARVAEGYEINEKTQSTIQAALERGPIDSLAIAKYFNYLARNSGFESAVLLGELTNVNEIKKYKVPVRPFSPLRIRRKDEGNMTHITYDFRGYYAWNMVKVETEWYNMDFVLDNFIKPEADESDYGGKQRAFDEKLLVYAPDSLIAESRFSSHSEAVLGVPPTSSNQTHLTSFKEQFLLSDLSEEMMFERAAAVISNKLEKSYSSASSVVIQVSSQEQLRQLQAMLPEVIAVVNDNLKNKKEKPIVGYKTLVSESTLSIVLANIQR